MNMITVPRLLACVAFAGIATSCTSGDDGTSAAGTESGSSVVQTSVTSTQSSGTDDTALRYPAAIECNLFYRPTISAPEGTTNTVSVNRTSKLTGDAATDTMGEFSFGVVYYGDVPEGETVVVSVRHLQDQSGVVGQTTYSSEQASVTSLHGFTGLQRLEVGGSELQWWCTSK